MKWEWEQSSGLIKEDGEAIAAVFGGAIGNGERACRNARLIAAAPEMYMLLEGLVRGEDIHPAEVLERVNGKEPDLPELKECPFCGGDAEVYEDEECFYVRCVDCCAQTDGIDTEIGAIDAWDRRKNTK